MDQYEITAGDIAQEFEKIHRPAILELAQLRILNSKQVAQIQHLTENEARLMKKIMALEAELAQQKKPPG